VALQLQKLGITRVRPLAGGLDAWMELEYPVEAAPLPAERASAGISG
jgi:3-mercaptopyruvate sulfurtransferase SseA